MLNGLLKKSFLLPLISFWMISFIIFAPTANILFSIPQEAEATGLSAIADKATYTAAIPVCEAISAARQAITRLWGSIKDVPSADASAGGTTAGATMQTCYKEWGDKIKNTIVESLTYAATTAMHQLLLTLTNQIVTCINSYDTTTGDCKGGDSLLVLDYNSLIQNVANIAGARFLNDLAGVNLCSTVPKVKLQMALLPTPDFKQRAACTLDKIVSNIDSFYADFTKGGWAAWEESAKPNNNAFGEWITATDEKMARQYAEIRKAEKETTNGFKSTKKCISTSNGSDPSTLKADDVNCSASMTTTPSGTVEFSTNFAAMSPIRSLENNLAGLYSKMGPFGIYLTAISNALLNKITSTGLSSLMSAITDTTTASDPYQGVINSVATTTTEYSNAQSNQSYASSIVSVLSTLDSYISTSAKSIYSDIISIITNIKNTQDKIIADYWAQGTTSSGTNISTISGPTTTTATDGTQTTTTTYNISNPKVGTAIIQKQIISYTTGISTMTYSVISSANQVEGIDGALTAYMNKNNSLTQTQSQIPGAKTQTQSAYDKTTTYLNSWTGTSTDTVAQSAMNTEITNTISYFQNPSNWMPALTSTALSGISADITSLYDTTINDISTEISNQTKNSYDAYLNDVQIIYSDLALSTTKF